MSAVVATLALAAACAVWALLQSRSDAASGDDAESGCGDCALWGAGCATAPPPSREARRTERGRRGSGSRAGRWIGDDP